SQTNTDNLTNHLKDVLLELNAHPYPDVPNPPETPKRASVALILRIQPNYSHWPLLPDHTPQLPHPRPVSPTTQRRRSSAASHAPHKLSFKDIIDAFFDQDWVKHGDPELLFIKRASREGDKWNGHVALPGGKRDPEDEDDQVTAVREALEEVGIDLSYNNAIAVGNLPQRVVTSSWGKVPLMVLCPYLYLLTSPTYPSQRLQPTEVASTHWVPLRALQSPSLRTHEHADVSARLARSELGIKRWFLHGMLSNMMFAAIRLLPSHSNYCATIPGFIPDSGPTTQTHKTKSSSSSSSSQTQHHHHHPPPLLLWGLTLGVVSDLLEHLPPHNALELWTYPTFTSWDVRFVMWALSYRFRAQKSREMTTEQTLPNIPSITPEDVETNPSILDPTSPSPPQQHHHQETHYQPAQVEVGIAGLGLGRHWGRTGRARMLARGAAVNSMLEGYYPIVRRAVALALVGRVGALVLGVLGAWR
ncbi:hypothetical protein DM02DRAFT_476804, partial [Periconia macrospinosa]